MADEDIVIFFKTCEKYLQRQLSDNDKTILHNIYEAFDRNRDIVEYLVEYCTFHNHRHPRYIEKVALGWREHGVKTLEDAKNRAAVAAQYRKILGIFGGCTSTITTHQKDVMDKWLAVYEGSLVLLACERATLLTERPNLNYVNTMLVRWHNAGIKTTEDVAEFDKKQAQSKINIAPTTYVLMQENTQLRNEVARLTSENKRLKSLLYTVGTTLNT